MSIQQHKKKGGAKIGRNKVSCERYRAQGRRAKNKLRRVSSHLNRHPRDLAAKRFVDEKLYLEGARGASHKRDYGA